MYTLIPLVLTALIALPLIIIAVYLIIRKNQKDKENAKMQEMFDEALDYDNDNSKKSSVFSPIKKIVDKYDTIMRGADLIKPGTPKSDVQLRLGVISLVLFLLAFIFSGFQVMFGFLPVMLMFGIIYVYCTTKIANTERMMEEQIPSFLSTLKSNIQANQTPERALVGAIDNTADPLYSELRIVKALIETGTFETAMLTLRNKTKSKTLRFLCSCIELSSSVGANLEDQIVVIEEMINRRKALDRKMDSAVAENKPLLYVSMFVIPFLFIFMYITNEQTRDFWFHGIVSWILFFFVIILCVIGYWGGNKIINSVRKM